MEYMSFLPNHETSINLLEKQRHYIEKKINVTFILMVIYDGGFVFLEKQRTSCSSFFNETAKMLNMEKLKGLNTF